VHCLDLAGGWLASLLVFCDVLESVLSPPDGSLCVGFLVSSLLVASSSVQLNEIRVKIQCMHRIDAKHKHYSGGWFCQVSFLQRMFHSCGNTFNVLTLWGKRVSFVLRGSLLYNFCCPFF
jgi:hypothetical protein